MMGRYGSDELNRFLLIVAAILIIIGIFVPKHWLNVVVVILLAIAYGRMFSRNHPKRQQENMKYLELKSRVGFGGGKSGPGGQGRPYGPKGPGAGAAGGGPGAAAGAARGGGFGRKKSADDGKRIFICPYCKGSLKVPVGAGRIKIKCPHCGRSFEETV